MKKTDITPEMFETWKAEMREVFKEDSDSMNLINICLNGLKNPKYADRKDSFNSRLLEFMENDLANKNELACPDCGEQMEVYYTVQCFHCKKPEIKDCEGNYIMATKWLGFNEPDFDDDAVWSFLTEYDILQGNDTYMKLLDDSQPDQDYNKNIRLFKKHFDIKTTKWFVSW